MLGSGRESRALMLVTDRRAHAGSALPDLARAAAAAGVDFIQVREKDLAARALLALVEDVVAAAAGTTLRVVVNGRPDVARLAGAQGVHLPERGLPAADVRAAFPGLIVGVSAHATDGVRRAEQAGAHYVVLGPVFASRGKERPLGLDALREAARAVSVPVIAIGGIDPSNVAGVWPAGVFGVAAIRAFLRAPLTAVVGALRDAPPA